jgi:hypothetical protein
VRNCANSCIWACGGRVEKVMSGEECRSSDWSAYDLGCEDPEEKMIEVQPPSTCCRQIPGLPIYLTISSWRGEVPQSIVGAPENGPKG